MATARTYASRSKKTSLRANVSDLAASSLGVSVISSTGTRTKPKRILLDSNPNVNPPLKKLRTSKNGPACKGKPFTQLHFNLETSVLYTCTRCGLTYTRGASEDEALHKTHCAKVQKGLEWRKEEEKDMKKAGMVDIAHEVSLRNGETGRIVAVRADVSGKIGNKISSLLDMVNLALSAPSLSTTALQASKVYLFLINSGCRQSIAGCVVAQRISTAMEIVQANDSTAIADTAALVQVDHALGLYCRPQQLATPLGISRIFVSSSYRRQGVAQALLAAAARTFLHGCELDASKGQAAFSQPTSLGRVVMEKWGNGAVRIFEE